MPRILSLIGALLWTGVILRIVVPWGRFVDHTHWGNVAWIPFISPPHRPLDVLLNVLLYVPLGRALSDLSGGRRRWWVVAVAAALSLATEWTRLYSHSRVPSLTDVVSNSCGALVGTWLLVATPGEQSRRLRGLSKGGTCHSALRVGRND